MRLFAMMPSPFDWKNVIKGKLKKEGPFDMVYAHELVRADDAIAFILCGHDEFAEAAGEFVDEADA